MILVVDDHAQVRKSVLRLLASHGHVAVAVIGGQQALDFLQAQVPRLVILDFNMPGVNGLDVLRAVRADTRLAALPVVMLTASLHDGTPAEIASLGVQGWIIKTSVGWVERLLEAAQRYAGDGQPPGLDSPA
jgi:CheY-like chemotaxis protein